MYLLWNVPVEVLGQTLAFREVESGDEAIVPRDVEGERAGIGVGDRDSDSDGDGMTSSGSVDSTQVNEALLAVKSQYTCYNQRVQDNDLPVLSGPPIRSTERPNGAVRCRQRHGRIKLEARKVNRTEMSGNVHLGCKRITQPPQNSSKCPERLYGDVRRCHQCGRIKFAPRNISQTEKVEMTYLGCTGTAQPPANAPKRRNGVHTTKCRCGRIKIEPIKVNSAQDLEKTYLERASTAQPP